MHTDPFETKKMRGANLFDKDEPFLFPRIDIDIGNVNYGKIYGGGGIHVDNANRLFSCLLYLGKPKMIEGDHRMYSLMFKNPILKKSIKPKHNLFFISLQRNDSLHDVSPIENIVGERRAIYVAISCNAKIWKDPPLWLAKLSKNRRKKNIFSSLVFDLKNKIKLVFNKKINDLS